MVPLTARRKSGDTRGEVMLRVDCSTSTCQSRGTHEDESESESEVEDDTEEEQQHEARMDACVEINNEEASSPPPAVAPIPCEE